MLRISTDLNKRKPDNRKARKPGKVGRGCQPVVSARNILKCGQDDRAPRYPHLTRKIQQESVEIRSIRLIRLLFLIPSDIPISLSGIIVDLIVRICYSNPDGICIFGDSYRGCPPLNVEDPYSVSD